MQKHQKVLILSREAWVTHSSEKKKERGVIGMSLIPSSDASSDSGQPQFSVKILEA